MRTKSQTTYKVLERIPKENEGRVTCRDLALVYLKEKGWTISEDMLEEKHFGVHPKAYRSALSCVRAIIQNHNDRSHKKIYNETVEGDRELLYWSE